MQPAHAQNTDPSNGASTTPDTRRPTFDPTHQPPSANMNVSCRGYRLRSGNVVDIKSGESCRDACEDRYSDDPDYTTMGDYTPFDSFDENDSFQYRQEELNGPIELVASCYCRPVYPFSLREEYLCGETVFEVVMHVVDGPIGITMPTPRCNAVGIYPYNCDSKCQELYPASEAKYSKYSNCVDYFAGCHCILVGLVRRADRIQSLCREDRYYCSNFASGESKEGLSRGAIVGIITGFFILLIGGAWCLFVKDQSLQPDQGLTDFRQAMDDQRHGRPAAQPWPTAPPPIEVQVELPHTASSNGAENRVVPVRREELVKANLFSYKIEEDGDAANIASLIAVAREESVRTRRNDNEEEKERKESWFHNMIDVVCAKESWGHNVIDSARSTISSVRNSSRRKAKAAECSICLCAYENGDTVAWSKEDECDHLYHEECIVQWCSTPNRNGILNDSCPLCRHKIILDESEA